MSWRPTPGQQQIVDELAAGDHRFLGLAWGRQSGKTACAARLGLITARTISNSRGWIVAPSHKLVEKAFRQVWLLIEQLGIPCRYKSWSRKHIQLAENGSIIEGYSTKDWRTSNMGDTLHWMIVDEVEFIEQDAWNLGLKACLAVNQGWALLIGTFEEGGGWWWERHEEERANTEAGIPSEWRMFKGATWEVNTAAFPGGVNDPKIMSEKRSMPREKFLAQYGGLVLPNALRVMKEWRRDVHMRPCPFNPNHPVEICIDPSAGGGNPYAVAAHQDYGTEVRQIDEYYQVGVLAEDVIADLQRRPWWGMVTHAIMDNENPSEVRRWNDHPDVRFTVQAVEKPQVEERLPIHRMWLREPGAYNACVDRYREEILKERAWRWHRLHPNDQLEVELLAQERVTRDEHIACAREFIDPRCQHTADEYLNYKRSAVRNEDRNLDEKPRKYRDHLMDCKGYWYWMRKRHGRRRGPDSYAA